MVRNQPPHRSTNPPKFNSHRPGNRYQHHSNNGRGRITRWEPLPPVEIPFSILPGSSNAPNAQVAAPTTGSAVSRWLDKERRNRVKAEVIDDDDSSEEVAQNDDSIVFIEARPSTAEREELSSSAIVSGSSSAHISTPELPEESLLEQVNVVQEINEIVEISDDSIVEEEEEEVVFLGFRENTGDRRKKRSFPKKASQDMSKAIAAESQSGFQAYSKASQNYNSNFPSLASSSNYRKSRNMAATKPLPTVLDAFSNYCKSIGQRGRVWNKAKPNSPRENEIYSDFIVCSYNVLCQKTTERTTYLYNHLLYSNSTYYLTWEHRWKLLEIELPSLNADILCLQEVQGDHYVTHYEPLMRSVGYKGHYKQKHGVEKKDDGCAIFYRIGIFEELEHHEVNFYVSPDATLNRENIAQILVLRCIRTKNVVLVANTHLIYNEERGDVKIAQLAMLFANIYEIQTRFRDLSPSVMIMGDFNIEPFSLIHDFITTGEQKIDKRLVRTMSGQSKRDGGKVCMIDTLLDPCTRVGLHCRFLDPAISIPVGGLIAHPFLLKSVYSNKNADEVSTFHKDKGNPDSIFYSVEVKSKANGKAMNMESEMPRLSLLQTYALPTRDTIRNQKPWPNQFVPSDHIPLIALFRFSVYN